MGGVVWIGTPIMHNMSGLSLARHWHGVWRHMHCSNHSGTICSCGWLLKWPALILVKYRVFLLACSVWAIRCIALLCLAILSPLCMDVHMSRVGGAMCPYRFCGIVCSWGLDV